MLLELAQKIVPAGLKVFLKPYFRLLFPHVKMALVMPTLRCNYRCSYCLQHGDVFRKRYAPAGRTDAEAREHTAAEWVAAMKDLPRMQLYFAGGEPMLPHDFPELVDGLAPYHGISGMVTNLSKPAEEYLRMKTRGFYLNVSYHREHTTLDAFVDKCLALKDHFKLMVNLVATKENIAELLTLREIFLKNGVTFHVDRCVTEDGRFTESDGQEEEILGHVLAKDRQIPSYYTSNEKKLCSAGHNYFFFLPGGEVFPCNTHAFEYLENGGRKPLGHLFSEGFKLPNASTLCDSPCVSACDYDRVSIKKAD